MIEKITLEMDPEGVFRAANGATCENLNPRELLLYAAALCAGRTALKIMEKERVKPVGFEISCSGELADESRQHEADFRSFLMLYNVACASEEDQSKVSRAVNLTQESHCCMVRMLRRIAPVAHEIAIVTTATAGA